jgi:hypothetical protein
MLERFRKLHQEMFRAYCDVGTTSAITAQRYIEELRQDYADDKRLEASGYKVYSQSDEDGIIAEIVRRIGTTNRRFVEFGCGAPGMDRPVDGWIAGQRRWNTAALGKGNRRRTLGLRADASYGRQRRPHPDKERRRGGHRKSLAMKRATISSAAISPA